MQVRKRGGPALYLSGTDGGVDIAISRAPTGCVHGALPDEECNRGAGAIGDMQFDRRTFEALTSRIAMDGRPSGSRLCLTGQCAMLCGQAIEFGGDAVEIPGDRIAVSAQTGATPRA